MAFRQGWLRACVDRGNMWARNWALEEPALENADNIRRGKGRTETQHPNIIDSRAQSRKSSSVGPRGAIHSRASKFLRKWDVDP